jgi:hypothetical protein
MKADSLKAFLSIIAIMGVLATGALAADDATAARKLKASITSPAAGSSLVSPVRLVGKVSGGVPPYTYRWAIPGGKPSTFTRKTSSIQNGVKVSYPPRTCTVRLTVIDSKRKRAVVRKRFTIIPDTRKSINSTSQNRTTFPASPVAEQPFVNQVLYRILAANDLGMHCGDLDHRIVSILPPFNVLHAQVIRTAATAGGPRQILTDADVDVVYSAASNPKDPALLQAPTLPVFKTNFWDLNLNTPPPDPANPLGFDAYDPFYPPAVLSPAAITPDKGLPVPDLALLYPVGGGGGLVAAQQDMPGVLSPYAANAPQSFARFDTDLPFFVNFPFGYRLTSMNWFAADGIPLAPFDDVGRKNAFSLMRVQARTKNTNLTGRAGDLLASVDAVLPVSAETDCWRCHTSSVDGGNAQAACLPEFEGLDVCPEAGSLRNPVRFPVTRAADDDPALPLEVRREWAAKNNILKIHDATEGTELFLNNKPVVCQKCHYTPALDLAHLGPLGPGDADANGRNQRIHQSNSRVVHTFHSLVTDLFDNDMPAPTDPLRQDAGGKLVVNDFVQDKLNNSCYLCHPGRVTKCLRGAMFNGGLVCFDCHGTMEQVGDDFSRDFPIDPFPGRPLNKRIPWADEPKCQSCHTGDALDNLTTDPNVIPSTDGIRLLQAYRTNDADATPIVATNKRFAENDANSTAVPPTVVPVLYRLSKGHGGVSCEGCHGSTHAEWPVLPESGATIANDNMAATQLQLHSGKITECRTCHLAGSLPIGGPTALDGPHGMHVVGEPTWLSGFHGPLAACPSTTQDRCRACHGPTGSGTVLSKAPIRRSTNIDAGEVVTCTTCHPWNPLDPTNTVPLPTLVCP